MSNLNLDINELIGFQVQSTADWRREKAKQFPDDARNLKAAEELDALAAEVELLNGSEIHKQIADITNQLYADDGPLDSIALNEEISSELRSIGFHSSYTGREFLEWFRDLLQEWLCEKLDEAVPIPDLAEQVANDPAVKAAKQAYGEVYAKAYAEARRKL